MPTVTYSYDISDYDELEEQRLHDRARSFWLACQDMDEWLRAVKSTNGDDHMLNADEVHERLWKIFNDNGIFIEEHTGRMTLRDWSRWGTIKYLYEEEQRIRAMEGTYHQTFAEWLTDKIF